MTNELLDWQGTDLPGPVSDVTVTHAADSDNSTSIGSPFRRGPAKA